MTQLRDDQSVSFGVSSKDNADSLPMDKSKHPKTFEEIYFGTPKVTKVSPGNKFFPEVGKNTKGSKRSELIFSILGSLMLLMVFLILLFFGLIFLIIAPFGGTDLTTVGLLIFGIILLLIIVPALILIINTATRKMR